MKDAEKLGLEDIKAGKLTNHIQSLVEEDWLKNFTAAKWTLKKTIKETLKVADFDEIVERVVVDDLSIEVV